jgi:glycosyltransferase involved in cell wall biosynthesis
MSSEKRSQASKKVTIITAAFNILQSGREAAFINCLESVRQQTYSNIEHWVIDGASTDGSIDLIKTYAEKGWVNYISEPDKGIYDAMSKGVQKATGDYLYFLNTDDQLFDVYVVQDIVDALASTDSDAIFGNLFPYTINPTASYQSEMKPNEVFSFSVFKDIYHLMDNNIHHQTIFYKKEIFNQCAFVDDQFKTESDWYLHIQAFLKFKFKAYYINRTIAKFNLGGVSTGAEENVLSDYQALKHNIKCEIARYPKNWEYYQYLLKRDGGSFRKWLFQIRTRKNAQCLRILGIDFIKPRQQGSMSPLKKS